MMGMASGAHGRMHACLMSGSPAASDVIPASALQAAWTRFGSASTNAWLSVSPPGRRRAPDT
jgi:hypothetical protein